LLLSTSLRIFIKAQLTAGPQSLRTHHAHLYTHEHSYTLLHTLSLTQARIPELERLRTSVEQRTRKAHAREQQVEQEARKREGVRSLMGRWVHERAAIL
jgi:hypothetical protein